MPVFFRSSEKQQIVVEPPALDAMVAWYRGDSLIGSGTASAWNDKSGNNYNMDAYNSPLIITNELNGKNVCRFIRNDPTTPYFFIDNGAPMWNGSHTIAIIHNWNVADRTLEEIFDDYIFYAGGGNISIVKHWDLNWEKYYHGGSVYGQVPDVQFSDEYNTDWIAILAEKTASYKNFYKNNVLVANGPNDGGLESWDVRLGSTFTNGSDGFSGDIAEVIIYNRILTSEERTELDAYIAGYYGI